jgi:hypothetical protein
MAFKPDFTSPSQVFPVIWQADRRNNYAFSRSFPLALAAAIGLN